jgi:hypothetical protein
MTTSCLHPRAHGGFVQSASARPLIRIDHVQHALAACFVLLNFWQPTGADGSNAISPEILAFRLLWSLDLGRHHKAASGEDFYS